MTSIVESDLNQIRTLDAGKPRKRILILGAGMSGLVAGYELLQLGHSVTIIEGNSRVGGRAFTHRFSDGQYHELGAMRIPASHDYTRHYVTDVLGLPLRPFISAHKNPNCFYFIRGIATRISEAAGRLLPKFDLSPRERSVATAAVAPAIMGQHFWDLINTFTSADVDALFARGPSTPFSEAIDQQSLGEFLEKRAQSKDVRELIGVTTGLEVWWDKALSMFLRDELAYSGDGLDEIVGGTDLLPTELAKRIGTGVIQLETEVVAIEAGLPVKVVTRSATNGIEVKEADYVVCALPFPILRRLQLTKFSARKLRAIRNLNYASSTKVLLHCKQRFWETNYNIYGGASLSDLISRSTYYPSDNVQARPPKPQLLSTLAERRLAQGLHTTFALSSTAAKEVEISQGPGVMVGSYNWGRDARRLGGLDPVKRAECVIDVLTNIHPEIRKHVDDSASMFWDENKWAGAAFCFMRPNDMRDYYADSIVAEGGLHFAGEHCSLDQAWIQGAAISSLRAIKEIVAV